MIECRVILLTGMLLIGHGVSLAKDNLIPGPEPIRTPRTLAEVCGQGGQVYEYPAKGFSTTFQLQATDCNGKVIPGSTQVATGVGEVIFDVPGQINGIKTADFRNRTIKNEHVRTRAASTGQSDLQNGDASVDGAVSVVNVESLYYDAASSTYRFEDVFGQLAWRFGNHVVGIPDLYADTNHDGHIGAGDVLYSWVDMRTYLQSVPGIHFDDRFTIKNGRISGIAGMWFSSTPIELDPLLGPVPTGGEWFDSEVDGAYAYTDHELSVPEPSTWSLMLIGLIVAAGAWNNSTGSRLGVRPLHLSRTSRG